MQGLYEDFIDNISTKDVVITDMNNEKELISQQSAEEWYKEMSASGKYNSMFIVCFNGSQEAKTNLRLIEKASKFLDSVLGARNEISDIHVSTLVTEEQISLQIPKDSIYDGILNWTSMPYPIYVKVACHFRGTVDSMLDTMLRFRKAKNAFNNESYLADLLMICYEPNFNWGWRYPSINGNVSSYIDDSIEAIITEQSDEQYRKLSINHIVGQLFNMHIWPIENLSELVSIVTKWADKRRMSALNEDFISIDDLHNDMTCLDSEQISFFHRYSYNTAIIIKQNNANGDYTQKILSLANRLDSSLKMLLDGKCSVKVCVYSDIMRDIMRNDVHLLTDEEMSVMYWQKDREKKKNFRSTDTFVWFDFPKSYSKFIMICKVVDELIEKAYGAFKEPSDIRMGCMNGDETFVHMTFPIGMFSQMYDCSDEEELEELKGNESGTYMFFYKKSFGNITIEKIWDKERQYMRERIKKNEQN